MKISKHSIMVLWVLLITAILTFVAGCRLSIVSADSKDVKFPLKDVLVEGDDGGYVAATLKGAFLKFGAVASENGAVIRCIYKPNKQSDSPVIEYRMACSGTEPGGLSVSSAKSWESQPKSLFYPASTFNGDIGNLCNFIVADFQEQIITQISRRNQEQAALTHAKVVSSSAQSIPTH